MEVPQKHILGYNILANKILQVLLHRKEINGFSGQFKLLLFKRRYFILYAITGVFSAASGNR